MRLSRKVTALALVSCMVLSMTACGGSKTAATEAATTPAETVAESVAETTAETVAEATGSVDLADKKVGISIYKFDDNFMTLYRTEL